MNARLVCALAITLALTACSRSESPAPAAETPPPAAHAATPGESTGESAAIQAALSNPSRFAGDAGEDAWRKSADVLAFMNVQPGMHVVDYLAGGGYYTELLSTLVGPEGRVYTYNNAEYTKYSGDTPAKRYANNRLGNVVTVTGAPESLAIEPSSLDAALFVQSYHDLHWKSKDWTPTDPAKSLAALVAALKPGATVVVVDHVAVAGSDPAVVVDSLHRIDPALVRKEFEAAGLVFDAESSILANSADDHTKSVFDESIRHKTDQFVYRFRKP